MPRALIIGGGLSGLASALFLRRLGYETLILEQGGRPGALARGFQRQGLRFETGFHYAGGLAEGGIARRYLTALGLTGLKGLPLPNPGGETLRFRDGPDLPAPHGLEAFKELFPPSPALDSFFDEAAGLAAASPFLNPALKTLSPLLNLASPETTLAEKMAGLPLNDRLKALLGFRCLLFGSVPARAAWRDFALVNTPFIEGAWTFEGGGEALAQAFEAALAQAGAEIRTGRQVVALETDGLVFRGLVSRGAGGEDERTAGDLCVYTGAPAALPALLPAGALRPALRRRLAELRPGPRPFMVFASTGTDFFESRQLFFLPELRPELWLAPGNGFFYLSGGPGRQGRRPLTIIGLTPESEVRPPGPPGLRSPEYIEFKKRRTKEIVREVLLRCPELDGDLEILDSASDATLRRHCFAQSGGLYGRSREAGEPPLMTLTRIKGLALAGQDIVMPGLLGTLVSAALAAGALTDYDEIWEILNA